MGKSSWKFNFLSSSIRKLKNTQNPNITVWSRNSIIPEFLIGKTVKVHNGKEFKPLNITEEKIGFKFGEFVFTRQPYTYKGKKKVIVKKK